MAPAPVRNVGRRVLLAAGLLLATVAVHAAATETVTVDGTDGPWALQAHMAWLPDPGGDMGLDAVQSAAEAGRFRPLNPTSGANLGYIDSVAWFRLRLRTTPGAAGRYILQIPYAMLDRVTLYQPGAPAERRIQQAGDRVPFSEHALAYRQPAFPVSLQPETTTLWLRVDTEGPKQVPARLWTTESFNEGTRGGAYLLGAYFGVLGAMGLYNLLVFFSLRDRNYLYYVLTIAGYTGFIVSSSGLGLQYLWPDHPDWSNTALVVGITFANLAALQFSRSFLDLAHYCAPIDRCMRALQWALGAMVVLAPVLPYTGAVIILTGTVFISALTMLGSGLLTWWLGARQARWFVIAWSVLLISSAAFSATAAGLLPSTFLTRNGIQIGSALEMILLSFALADRMRLLQNDNDRIRREATERLEARVERRTEALREAYDQLADANHRLQELSLTDPLTGVRNRQGLTEALQREWQRAQRSAGPLTLIMVDVDRFKAVNDTYGHPIGDTVLQHVAQALSGLARRGLDEVARYGGEEFVLLLPQTDLDGARTVAERGRAEVAACAVEGDPRLAGVTVSAGVAVAYPASEGASTGAEALLARADRALYAAKGAGRDCTEVAEPDSVEG